MCRMCSTTQNIINCQIPTDLQTQAGTVTVQCVVLHKGLQVFIKVKRKNLTHSHLHNPDI